MSPEAYKEQEYWQKNHNEEKALEYAARNARPKQPASNAVNAVDVEAEEAKAKADADK